MSELSTEIWLLGEMSFHEQAQKAVPWFAEEGGGGGKRQLGDLWGPQSRR